MQHMDGAEAALDEREAVQGAPHEAAAIAGSLLEHGGRGVTVALGALGPLGVHRFSHSNLDSRLDSGLDSLFTGGTFVLRCP